MVIISTCKKRRCGWGGGHQLATCTAGISTKEGPVQLQHCAVVNAAVTYQARCHGRGPRWQAGR
jgi:hypothetical protein